MKILEQIKLPIKKEMDLFEEKFSNSMISDVPLLNRITHYVVKRKGKQMRPMFVFLTAKTLIGRKGYQIDEAMNGQQAVEKHMENHYDLILMDCQMPVMDGIELCEMIKNDLRTSHIPIMMITAKGMEVDKIKGTGRFSITHFIT